VNIVARTNAVTQTDVDASLVELKQTSREKYAPLINELALTGDRAHGIIDKLAHLFEANPREIAPWFELWKEHCDYYFDLDAADAILASDVKGPSGTLLFLAQTYCKIVLTELVHLALGRAESRLVSGSLYNWVDCLEDDELKELRSDLRRRVADIQDVAQLGAISSSDLLATVYQEILPPPLRHLLGEYYTPSWLVEYCINEAERRYSKVGAPITVLDPAAGSGGFLAHYIAHLAATGFQKPVNIVGFDVNPLAVDFCRANTFLAVSKGRENGHTPVINIKIHLADAVVDPISDSNGPLFGQTNSFEKKILGVDFSSDNNGEVQLNNAILRFDLPARLRDAFLRTLRQHVLDIFSATRKVGADIVMGNPPWITWDGLTRRYRESVAPQWASSTLVVNTGWRAKVAAGKTDFSSLFVYRAAQRHATDRAVMVFALPLSLFQSHLAGAGFRTFQTTDHRSFALVQLDDFSEVKVFADAINRTSVGTFVVDQSPQYPIRYCRWSSARPKGGNGRLECVSSLGGPLVSSERTSPIVAFEHGHTRLQTVVGKSDYRARGGVNTGGANTILWLEVLGQTDSLVTVRNVGKSRRGSSPVVTAEVEKDAVYPLLCGTDMRRWKAVPSKSILLLYAPDQPKKALPLSIVQENLPRAYDFLSQFRAQLEGRKEYHRWGCSGPFYEVYRIGPYTFSPIKVVWQHTGYRKALNVSVVDDRSRRLTIPDQKAILIPFDHLAEAHYVCAFLSSATTASLLDRYLGTDASTHILDYVALRRFIPGNPDHQRLADLSVSAHETAARGAVVEDLEIEIDSIVARLVCAS
jgi:methylase of polypeptide subunit release factors